MKPVAKIIDEHKRDFEALAGIEELIVLGFSYSEIDMSYLEKISKEDNRHNHVERNGGLVAIVE